jgi:hypothetical protein
VPGGGGHECGGGGVFCSAGTAVIPAVRELRARGLGSTNGGAGDVRGSVGGCGGGWLVSCIGAWGCSCPMRLLRHDMCKGEVRHRVYEWRGACRQIRVGPAVLANLIISDGVYFCACHAHTKHAYALPAFGSPHICWRHLARDPYCYLMVVHRRRGIVAFLFAHVSRVLVLLSAQHICSDSFLGTNTQTHT